MKKGQFLFLGTGASAGVPMIGCTCSVCASKDPHNQRLRPSGLLTIEGKQLLIDAGPDLRQQALKFQIHHVDGVLITHTHYDHIASLDELRSYYILHKMVVPVLVSSYSYENIKKRYDYLFAEIQDGNLTAQLDFHLLEQDRGQVEFLGLKIDYMTYEQGGMKVTGFRVGNFAYISDIRHYSDTIFEDLAGVKYLVLSALRKKSSTMHFTIDEACVFAKKIGAEQTYFTHIAHDVDHHLLCKELPQGINLAYDGLAVEFIYG